MTSGQQLALVGLLGCWGAFAVVWVLGAVYNRVRGPRRRGRNLRDSAVLFVLVVACAVPVVVTRDWWQRFTFNNTWLMVVGLVILVASTAFTIWARVALGVMWNLAPSVKETHELRTSGPYSVTRHPIYTGILGMLLGSTLLVGAGPAIVLLPIGVVLLEAKIAMEERLMVATFPDEYPAYRRRVPQVVPGLRGHRAGRSNRQAG